ncbi:Aldo/keto reductase [Penicillium hordei]|uniref:Aldo/keto reductase n=1 Tax=Penicillium hordei TaxID=40994 RepID=A0AAD6GUN2_9EURO|nr:Aldo/keto reductase [Penicillium hordei]KAJ5589335.1 Aldo/keto reductase [Penicillium hordei]
MFIKQKQIPRDRCINLPKCYFGVGDKGRQPPNRATIYDDGKVWVSRVGPSWKHLLPQLNPVSVG